MSFLTGTLIGTGGILVLFGYIWMSSSDDAALYDQQHQALLAAGVASARIYEDLDSPRRDPRPQLDTCLMALQAGDTLVVWQLDRVVRSRAHLLDLLPELWQRKIALLVLTGKAASLTKMQIGLDVVLAVVTAFTELEDQIVREATSAGLTAARARGQYLGGKRKMTAELLRQAMTKMTTSDASMAQIAEDLEVTRATLYNYLHGDGSPKPAGLRLLGQDES